ncbi:hypothetical protein AMTR_s00054p00202510 [Amborella trichopoda]|uniref:Uncharacterized protein n=1 Tax=Amborella trichopoda TaxID=13333 RepID=U5DCR2_AMBTC|nr:hypothetical protein AMTR_s00054p00202510 [Amborella trichopoda]
MLFYVSANETERARSSCKNGCRLSEEEKNCRVQYETRRTDKSCGRTDCIEEIEKAKEEAEEEREKV